MNPGQRMAQRKRTHIRLADEQAAASRSNDFDLVSLVRPALPETRVNQRVLLTDFFGAPVSAPFFINAMTGGTNEATAINGALCRVARKTGIAMAFGSADIVSKDFSRLDGFLQARAENPDGPVLVNVNPTTPVESVRLLVDRLKPVALQIHVNAVQEAVMPEGDRDFRWMDGIKRLRQAMPVPVVVKEVGFGFDVASIGMLAQAGVDAVDVSGKGGTDFATIENARSLAAGGADFSYLQGIGASTVQSLLNARLVAQLMRGRGSTSRMAHGADEQEATMPIVIASGGVRNPLDVLKCLAMGARWVGVSGRFLHILLSDGEEALERAIESWKSQLAMLLALYGAKRLPAAARIDWTLEPRLESYLRQMRALCGLE